MKTIPQQDTLLNDLNDGQRAAVEYCDGPSLVIAGAGSGKTRVLTYKIAYLLAGGVEPWNILALTFTNKAAREMKERVGQLIGHDRARRLFMGTFHSVFSRILRREAGYIGFNSNFTIYDETDARSLLKSIVKEMQLDDKVYKPAAVHSRISMAKNHLKTAEQYANDGAAREYDHSTRMPAIAQIYSTYQARCRQANAMDFDDLLLYTFLLLREHPEVRSRYAQNFRYILVDEYQDTNFAQVAIVRLLAEVHRRVCVVGDDYQSIYSFRGANIDNILGFKNSFDEARLFKLERNYRSTQFIVQAANSLMKHNSRQIPKEVYSREDEGDHVLYKPCYSDKEEAMVVVKEIQRIQRQDGCEYGDFAILYRTNAQSRSFEDEMRKNAIPYRIYGGLSFYQRKEIKDIIAYFRLAVNPDDEEAFRRIINYPVRGIGSTTVQRLIDCAQNNGISLWEVLQAPERYDLNANKGTLAKLSAFRELMTGYIRQLPKKDAYELGKDIIRSSGIAADINSGSAPDDLARQENLDEFLSALQAFVETNREEGREEETYLTDYLQNVALYSDLDKSDDGAPKVTLMTIHAAKGLEFPTVFVVGLEENLFPSPISATTKRGLEEERRLLYVAITRAERHCILTNAKNRFRYGSMQFDNPSRFLNDIDPRFLHADDASAGFASSHNQLPWDSAGSFHINTGSRPRGRAKSGTDSRWQNSHPVASQFRADLKPKQTERKRPESAVDPLSDRTRQHLLREGGSLRRLSSAIAHGGRTMPTPSGTRSAESFNGLYEGATIEHQRFGIGTVERLEGVGENAKATVAFRNAGTKQLLLKFAKYKIL